MAAAPITLFALLLAVPVGSAPSPGVAREGAGGALSEADVRQLLRDWPAFERAMARLPEAVPQIPQSDGTDTDLSAAEAAWAADAQVRGAFETSGTTPETFLSVYRRVAQAWWELLEREARDQAAIALRREIAALRETGDEDATEVIAELERGLAALQKGGRPSQDVVVVRRYRAELEKVFSPADSRRAP